MESEERKRRNCYGSIGCICELIAAPLMALVKGDPAVTAGAEKPVASDYESGVSMRRSMSVLKAVFL